MCITAEACPITLTVSKGCPTSVTATPPAVPARTSFRFLLHVATGGFVSVMASPWRVLMF